MHRIPRYLGSLLLGVALIAPVGIQAGNNFRDDRRQDARERNERNQRRYYDRDHAQAAARAAESILEVSPRTSGW
jgi:hypothetical protein